QKVDAPAADWLSCSESAVPPLHSSTTRPKSRHSSAPSSTLAPTGSQASRPPLSVLTSPVLCAAARSECSSPTSVRSVLIANSKPSAVHHPHTDSQDDHRANAS